MIRTELVFLLEEESAKIVIESVLQKIKTSVTVRFIVFDGKQDLEKQLERKLRGYLNPNAIFVVLRDQDLENCRKVKKRLVEICKKAGRPTCKVRIACRELESFYLGDLAAVEKGFGLVGLSRRANQAQFRNPDELQKPSELLRKLTKERFQKVSGARAIAPHLHLTANRSNSFLCLVELIRVMTTGPTQRS